MYFDHIQLLSKFFPNLFPLLYPHNFESFLLLNPSSSIYAAHIFLDVFDNQQKYHWFTMGYTLKETWFSLSQELTIASKSSVGYRTLCPPSISMLGFGLALSCTVLVNTPTTTVASYVQLPASLKITVALYLPTTPPIKISESWEGGCHIDIPFRDENSTVF